MARSQSVFAFNRGIFDLDGTLVDSMGACTRIFADLAAERGLDRTLAEASYLRITTTSLEENFRRVLREQGRADDDRVVAGLMARFADRIKREHIDFFPGARRLIRRLRQNRATLFVSSGSPDEVVRRRLGAETTKGMFRLTLGSTNLVKGPAHLRCFARAAGLSVPEFARGGFLCGDLEIDMLLARQAGLYAIGVATTISAARLFRAGAHRVVPDIRTLLNDRK